MRHLFEKQRASLNYFFDQIDLLQAEKVFQKLLSCKGVVILSGVGKSGHIAQKIATTLSSTGTRSIFLSAAHALHGDIGIVTDKDLFIAFSKSGESEELLHLLPYIQKKGASTIAVVSRSGSRLEKNVELSIQLPVQRELCPYDLAPTTSTAVQLLFGDCLAMALMEAKQFTVADFAANHPAGFLGRKLLLSVQDLMLQGESLPLCAPQNALIEVLHELTSKKCGCLLVCDEKKRLEGIFTDGDLRRAIQIKGPSALQMPLSELMTKAPITTEKTRKVVDAIHQMEENPHRLITALPVIENQVVIGLLRMHDIIQAGLR